MFLLECFGLTFDMVLEVVGNAQKTICLRSRTQMRLQSKGILGISRVCKKCHNGCNKLVIFCKSNHSTVQMTDMILEEILKENSSCIKLQKISYNLFKGDRTILRFHWEIGFEDYNRHDDDNIYFILDR